jgi:hypothetical protein
MISEKGEKGREEVIRPLDERCRESLCPNKCLTGGIEIVQKVCCLWILWISSASLSHCEQILKTPYGKVLNRVLEDGQDHCEATQA